MVPFGVRSWVIDPTLARGALAGGRCLELLPSCLELLPSCLELLPSCLRVLPSCLGVLPSCLGVLPSYLGSMDVWVTEGRGGLSSPNPFEVRSRSSNPTLKSAVDSFAIGWID